MTGCTPNNRYVAQQRRPSRQAGFSLLEALAVLLILGLLATVVLPRFLSASDETRRSGCYTYKGNVEIQVQLWHRSYGSMPDSDLGDIGGDTDYFPEGVPTCPVDGSPYTIDTTTGQVVGHNH